MKIVKQDVHTWCQENNLKIKKGICPICHQPTVANIPFKDEDLNGLISQDHGCGLENCLIVFKSSSRTDKCFWGNLGKVKR